MDGGCTIDGLRKTVLPLGAGLMNFFPSTALRSPENGDDARLRTKTELDRVLSLSRRNPFDCMRHGKAGYVPLTQALVEIMTERFSVTRPLRPDGTLSCGCRAMGYKQCITELNAEQAWTLREISREGGGIGFLPVGSGKSILSTLAPFAIPHVRSAVILAKSDQRLHYRKTWLRLREHFRVPSFVMDDGGEPMIVRGAPVLHYIAYSKLSRPESTKLLADLNPDLIIADEMHCLSAVGSSRTLRFLRFMMSRQGIYFVGWSGSLLEKSIRNVAHLSAHALGTCSPLPTNPDDVEAWASVLDPSPQPDRSSSMARAIYRAFGGDSGDLSPTDLLLGLRIRRVREGFRKRLAETPGIVTSRATSSAASITIHEREVVMPEGVREALLKVRSWTRPDGEELVEAVEQARCARECASGFFYYIFFTDAIPCVHGLEFVEDCAGCQSKLKITDWLAKRKAFNKELRERIQRGEEYLDSRFLCEQAAERAWKLPPYEGDLPSWRATFWPSWKEVRDTVPYEQRVRWIDDYLAHDVAKWASENRGVVWTLSRAFGKRVSEIGKIPYHGGGPGAEAAILSEDGSRSIVVSIKAHGEGRDGLQHRFSKQLVAELPSGGKTWGQLLGRLCRPGQIEDTVETWVYAHYQEARDALRNALSEAEYNTDMTANAHLLGAADFTFEL